MNLALGWAFSRVFSKMGILLEPAQFGDLNLRNRIVLAPLTRCRAGPERTPNALMREYYVQRASAGMILTEATSITPMGVGYPNTPGIWSEEQVAGWRSITDAVHEAGGLIVSQLWHVGRISHQNFLDGASPVAPSAIAAAGPVRLMRPKDDYPVPRAIAREEIPGIIADYRQAAENAKRAGFDGVELHGANGYLPDQFLQDSTNTRTDDYGGSIENRARFLLEAVDVLIDVWGAGRVGVHLAPRGDSNDMGDSNPAETFGYVARELAKRKVAFIFVRESEGAGALTAELKRTFGGPVIANESRTKESAEAALNAGDADAVSFGRLYIANPDLPERFATGAELNEPDPSTFYSFEPEGYVDYPTLPAVKRTA